VSAAVTAASDQSTAAVATCQSPNNYVTNWRNRLNSTQYNHKTLQTFYGQTTCYDAAAFSDPTRSGVLG